MATLAAESASGVASGEPASESAGVPRYEGRAGRRRISEPLLEREGGGNGGRTACALGVCMVMSMYLRRSDI
jgi:hypothetical protein